MGWPFGLGSSGWFFRTQLGSLVQLGLTATSGQSRGRDDGSRICVVPKSPAGQRGLIHMAAGKVLRGQVRARRALRGLGSDPALHGFRRIPSVEATRKSRPDSSTGNRDSTFFMGGVAESHCEGVLV